MHRPDLTPSSSGYLCQVSIFHNWKIPEGTYTEYKDHRDYFCYYGENVNGRSHYIIGPHSVVGPAQGWKNKDGNWAYIYAISGEKLTMEDWAQKTNHMLCEFCQNFCHQGCFKFK